MSGVYIIQGLGVQAASTQQYKAGIEANQRQKLGIIQMDKPLYNSKLGTPVFSDLVVDPFNYTIDGVTYYVPGIKTYDIILVTSGNKNIVKTTIQGLNGDVKEYVNTGPDTIVIEGVITGNNGVYPYNEVSDLKKLIDAPVAFKVTSRFLQTLNIDTLVIEGYELPQIKGGYSYQNFKLYCVTDIPVELNIISSSNTTAL